MGKEIERKFLVKGDFSHLATREYKIIQRYLCIDETKVIRVRITGSKALITIKGAPGKDSFTRSEWEIPIRVEDASELMNLCLPGKIVKTRYIVPSGRHIFEVDVFHDRNEGLVIAELELESESEVYEKPEWLGEEVTGRQEFYNAMLIK